MDEQVMDEKDAISDSALQWANRNQAIRKAIYMVPGVEVVRNPSDPRLYAPNKAVKNPQDTRIVEMTRTLVAHHLIEGGMGLAAPQIGWNVKACAIRNPGGEGTIVFYNPRIVSVSELFMNEENFEYGEEGCISHPGVWGSVPRLKAFQFIASTFSRPRETRYEASGMFARVLQHEIDHLKGRLFTDLPNVKDLRLDSEGQVKLLTEKRKEAELGFPEPEVD
jgi:peptide deformylase